MASSGLETKKRGSELTQMCRSSGCAALVFAMASTSAAAKCVYDAELGEVRDVPGVEMAIAFFLVVIMLSYPLKEWATRNTGLATVAVFAVPIVVGFVSGGGRC